MSKCRLPDQFDTLPAREIDHRYPIGNLETDEDASAIRIESYVRGSWTDVALSHRLRFHGVNDRTSVKLG